MVAPACSRPALAHEHSCRRSPTAHQTFDTLAAAVSGWWAVHLVLRLVVRVGFGGIAAYRVVAGLTVLALLATPLR